MYAPLLAVLAAGACGGSPGATPSAPSVVHANGPIWFLGGNPPGSTFGRPTGLYRVDSSGGGLVRVPLSNQQLSSITSVTVSPNGTMVALSNGGGEFPPRNIVVMASNGSHLRKITSGNFFEVSPAWSPDSHTLAFSSTRCCATAQNSGNYALYTMTPTGSSLRRLTTDPGANDVSPAWSPDGHRIAYVRLSNRGSWEIWLVNTDGSGAHALTHDQRLNDAVAWSPDGRQLAYTSHLIDDHDWQVRVMAADGSGTHTVYTCSGRCHYGGYAIAWSPDGKQLAFTISLTPRSVMTPRIATINATGGGFRLIDTHGVGACCLSWLPRSQS